MGPSPAGDQIKVLKGTFQTNVFKKTLHLWSETVSVVPGVRKENCFSVIWLLNVVVVNVVVNNVVIIRVVNVVVIFNVFGASKSGGWRRRRKKALNQIKSTFSWRPSTQKVSCRLKKRPSSTSMDNNNNNNNNDDDDNDNDTINKDDSSYYSINKDDNNNDDDDDDDIVIAIVDSESRSIPRGEVHFHLSLCFVSSPWQRTLVIQTRKKNTFFHQFLWSKPIKCAEAAADEWTTINHLVP